MWKSHLCHQHFKCLGYYCIPWQYVCNGRNDCPFGDDEARCSLRKCVSLFKCKGRETSPICIHQNQMCDNIVHCPDGDDEIFCNLPSCPSECKCIGAAMTCRNMIISHWMGELTFWYVSIQASQLPVATINKFRTTIVLNIMNSSLKMFCKDIKAKMTALRHFDVSNNYIPSITKQCLCKFPNVMFLNFSANQIEILPPTTSSCLFYLLSLDLSFNKISFISKYFMKNLPNLRIFNILNNRESILSDKLFDSNTLHLLLTSDFHVCCLTNKQTTCTAKFQWPFICGSLLASQSLRVMVWILSLGILLVNMLALIIGASNLYQLRCQKKKCAQDSKASGSYEITVAFLNFADYLNGVQLIMVAGADMYYGNTYTGFDVLWRTGFLCNFISILSLFANLLAVFILAFLAISRFLIVRYPFERKYTQVKFVLRILMAGTVTVTVFITCYLSFFLSISKHKQPLPMCLMYGTPGGIQSIVSIVFASAQLLAAGIILISYTTVIYFLHITEKSKSDIGLTSKSSLTKTMIAKLVVVNLTNVICWIPSSILLYASVGADQYPISLLFWVALVLTPFNSILNPCILRLDKHLACKCKQINLQSVDIQSEVTKSTKSQ